MDRDFILWFAGFVDGEGCIGIVKHKYFPVASFQLGNTDRSIMDYIRVCIGVGKVHTTHVNKQHKPYHYISINNADAFHLCCQLFPHLKIKRLQAETVIEFWKKLEWYKEYGTQSNKPNFEIYMDRIHQLNKRGL